ncbi:hypothetical protein ACLMAJ_15915 [Nocardia sp. KC 131]|uniref:hypothetical protein n=1 Tax=Nocardia arseniciresistens TaxID=3392119 RepID=UPI00398F4D90
MFDGCGARTAAPYITIPIELWSHGWINVMSARALFVYLILRLITMGRDTDRVHVSVTDRKNHAIKDDTWQRGLKELETLGLAHSMIAKNVAEDRWHSELLTRKVTYLDTERLKTTLSPLEPVDSKKEAPQGIPDGQVPKAAMS